MSSRDDDVISRRLRARPEIDAPVREIPAEIASTWPGARRVSLALGDALRLSLPPSAHALKRLQQAASRLVREPKVQEAAQRALAIAKRWEPLTVERDRDFRREQTFHGQAQQFAAAHHFPYLSARDIARLLPSYFAAVFHGHPHQWTPPLPHGPVMFVNPLADAELSAPVAPGHILIDVTHAKTEADLLALRPHIKEAQRRLQYDHRGGGIDPFCLDTIRLAIRQFKGIEPPGSGEVARLVYGADDPAAARDAYRKCLQRNNRRHEDILREEGWTIPDR